MEIVKRKKKRKKVTIDRSSKIMWKENVWNVRVLLVRELNPFTDIDEKKKEKGKERKKDEEV